LGRRARLLSAQIVEAEAEQPDRLHRRQKAAEEGRERHPRPERKTGVNAMTSRKDAGVAWANLFAALRVSDSSRDRGVAAAIERNAKGLPTFGQRRRGAKIGGVRSHQSQAIEGGSPWSRLHEAVLLGKSCASEPIWLSAFCRFTRSILKGGL